MSLKDTNNEKYTNNPERQDNYNYHQHYTHICRVCLNEKTNLLPLFGQRSSKYCTMLNFCTTIQAEEDDNFPHQICRQCTENLEIAYDFKKLAEKSNGVLLNRFIKKIKTKLENPLDTKSFPVGIVEDKANNKKNSFMLKSTKTEFESSIDISFDKSMVNCESVIKEENKDDSIPTRNLRTPKKEPKSDDDCSWKLNHFLSDDCSGNSDDTNDETFDIEKMVKKKKKNKEIKTRSPKEREICPICGILTLTMGTHLQIHEEIKPYYCEKCKKYIARKYDYQVHVKTHTGDKDHICETCGAAFYSRKSVKKHKLTHTGERPFSCNLCPKTFSQRYTFNRHLTIHSGYKPYNCSECKMCFNAKNQLTTHMRMHTGEKPYKCEICKTSFGHKVNFNNHVHKVHGVNLRYQSIHIFTTDVLNQDHQADYKAVNFSPSIIPLKIPRKKLKCI